MTIRMTAVVAVCAKLFTLLSRPTHTSSVGFGFAVVFKSLIDCIACKRNTVNGHILREFLSLDRQTCRDLLRMSTCDIVVAVDFLRFFFFFFFFSRYYIHAVVRIFLLDYFSCLQCGRDEASSVVFIKQYWRYLFMCELLYTRL